MHLKRIKGRGVHIQELHLLFDLCVYSYILQEFVAVGGEIRTSDAMVCEREKQKRRNVLCHSYCMYTAKE